jgi:hypothetical protein
VVQYCGDADMSPTSETRLAMNITRIRSVVMFLEDEVREVDR